MKAGGMIKWPKRATAHCTGCGEFFRGVTPFDRHQTGVDPVICHPPGERNLIKDENGVWGMPPSGFAASK